MSIPVTTPCNICGGTQFRPGPSDRLSITKRLPTCGGCGSLERHRVVHAAFDAIPRKFLEGTRCLQISQDPALNAKWFAELTYSVDGGDNSLDLQAMALPDASYDWIYSSHVINHVSDEQAVLTEMLRVVGDGCVVLNVGGSVFNYMTRVSEAVVGKDRQYKIYGTLYADDLQATLPEVAVLELVAIDPCSVSLDSVYFASRNEARLTQIATAATERNVHARVFPAKKPREKAVAIAPQKRRDPWEDLRNEIRAWAATGAKARFWLRDDDATRADPLLVELIDLCERERIPLALAMIPLPSQPELIALIEQRKLITPLQHGFDHGNRSPEAPKSEFPPDRPLVESLRTIRLGWQVMSESLGDRALRVFVPPWGTCAPQVQAQLKGLGFIGYSGSRVAGELHRRGKQPEGLALASAHVPVNRTARNGGEPVPEQRVLEFLTTLVRAIRNDAHDRDEPVGVMTHHWGVDISVRVFLKRLFDETRAAGATWVSAQDLFMPKGVAASVVAETSMRQHHP